MPATITGIIFNDLNHNGQFDPGEPGIANAFLTLRNTSTNTCVQTIADAGGNYSFTISAAGTYRIYETVTPSGVCPPTVFTQPAGFTVSNGPRVLSVTVTAAQVNNNAVIPNQNFSHDTTAAPLACTTTLVQFVNTPTEWININVVTGVSTLEGLLIPADNVNAIGYNSLDNYIYGYDQTTHHIVRVDNNRMLTQLVPNPTGLPVIDYNVGAFDLNGHLFLMVNDTARFYTVDLEPNSPTFMKLVDPANGYAEQTSNFGTPLSIALNVSDWAFNPVDNFLYGVRTVGNTGQVMRVNPATGAVTALSTTMPVLSPTGRSWGAVAIDASGSLFAIYNGDGGVYRFEISGVAAVGIRISTTFATSFNDGTMCPGALVGAVADLSVLKTAEPDPVRPGEQILFTVVVSNAGPDNAENVTLLDVIPADILGAEYSLNGGATFFPWTGEVNLGTFASGTSETVLIRGTVDPFAAGVITNTVIVGSSAQDPNPDNNTSTVEVPVAELSADMTVTKTASPDPVRPGEEITFTVKVSNQGPDAAQDVTLTDVIPPDIIGAEYSTDSGATFQPWPDVIFLGTFLAGESDIVLIRGTVSPEAAGVIFNTAVVSSATPDPDPDNNADTVEVIVEALSADMTVTKTASPDPVRPGEEITFTVTVTNLGPGTAQDVTLTDVIPPDISGAEYSTNGGATFQPWPDVIDLGTFLPGESETILIRGTVNPEAEGVIFNTAVVSSATPDPNPDNNEDTVEVIVEELSADMTVTKTASPDPVRPGEEITFTVTVSNLGPDTAQDVTLTDVIPPDISGAEYSTNGGATFQPWPGVLGLGDFSAGESETVLIRGTVSPEAEGVIFNTAVVSSATPDPDPDNNADTVEVIVEELSADMTVTKTASPDPVRPGEVLTFTVTVSNLGPDTAQDVTLTDVIPPDISGAEYSTNGGATFQPWPGAVSLGDFAAGESEAILIRGTVNPEAEGVIFNTAVVSSATPDPDPDNNADTVEVIVEELSADMTVTKTASPDPVLPGEVITFTVTVTNLGPDTAQDVTLTDIVSPQISGAEYSTDGGMTFQPWPDFLALGSFAPGEDLTILIRGTVNPGATGVISNTAVVSSATPDPDPDNNTDTVIVVITGTCDARCQAITDLIESVALEEAALAHILNAEGEKLQAIIAAPDVSPETLLEANASVQSMTSAVAQLECILLDKLSLFGDCLCGDS